MIIILNAKYIRCIYYVNKLALLNEWDDTYLIINRIIID